MTAVEQSVHQLTEARRTAPAALSAKQLRELRDQIGQVQGVAREAHRKTTGLETDVQGVKGDMGIVRRQVFALEGNVSMVEGSLKAVDQSVQNMEREFKSMGLKSFVRGVWGRG